MALLRTLRSHRIRTLFRTHNPSHQPPQKPFTLQDSVLRRPFSLSVDFQVKTDKESKKAANAPKAEKPLSIIFKEAVGLIADKGKDAETDVDSEGDSRKKELKGRLRKLEEEVRSLDENRKHDKEIKLSKKKVKSGEGVPANEGSNTIRSLYTLFGGEKLKGMNELAREDDKSYRKLSPHMVMFVKHLYHKRYFKGSQFVPMKSFDTTYFDSSFARGYIKYAAEQFGKDNRLIAKWLSGHDMKKVASFGCPTISKQAVFSAKRLRTFFRIPENTVCSKCALRNSCKFADQDVWGVDSKKLDLVDLLKVITLYAMELNHPQLVVPEEIKESYARLLKDIVNLSKTMS